MNGVVDIVSLKASIKLLGLKGVPIAREFVCAYSCMVIYGGHQCCYVVIGMHVWLPVCGILPMNNPDNTLHDINKSRLKSHTEGAPPILVFDA